MTADRMETARREVHDPPAETEDAQDAALSQEGQFYEFSKGRVAHHHVAALQLLMDLRQHRELVGLQRRHDQALQQTTADMHQQQTKRHGKAATWPLIGNLPEVLL